MSSDVDELKFFMRTCTPVRITLIKKSGEKKGVRFIVVGIVEKVVDNTFTVNGESYSLDEFVIKKIKYLYKNVYISVKKYIKIS